MFLKAIEIRGFKSFADKTELAFTNGVTSIVGPNGSGKSNISDAVRWVLGEQSVKNLRGGKMEDVIFSGTQFRKPLGLCQVSLTLDNEDQALPIDYTSVTVLRRLYRSGESEYYINNTKCRLKDVYELFMDTGLGKEGYSIIGQGKIDLVLSGKPEERRSLLEEAAGIVKFKWRKEEAEKRLKNTNENLVRIEDILGTYEERLEPLSIENKKANEFLKISEGLKENEINLLVNSIDEIQIKIDKLKNLRQDNKKIIDNFNSKFVKLKCSIDSWNNEIQHINEVRNSFQKNYYNSKTEIQKKDSDINLLKERISNLKSSIEKNSSEYKDAENKLVEIIKEKQVLGEDFSKLDAAEKNLTCEIINYSNNLNEFVEAVSNKNSSIKDLKDNQIEYLSTVSNLKNSIAILKENMEKSEEKQNSIKNSCRDYQNSIKINTTTSSMLESEIGSINKKINNCQIIIQKNKGEILKFKASLKKEQLDLKNLNNIYIKLHANHNMLINLDRQYEGYNRAVKMLMKDIKAGKVNVDSESCFVLGETIKVDKKFEVAIEIALGAAISNIITKDEILAKQLINYLKTNNLGRATFLPLTIIRSKRISGRGFDEIDGYIGIASDIVNYDRYFKNAVEYALGRTIISRDLDSALKIAGKSNYTVRIVTLKGEIVNPGGALTGGSLKGRGSNIIGRKREIKDIEFKLEDTGDKIKVLNENVLSYEDNIKKLDEKNLDLKDEIYSNNIDITKLEGKISNINSENLKLEKNIDISKKEIDNIILDAAGIKSELENKKNELKDFDIKQNKNNEEIIILEKELQGKNKRIDYLREKLTDIKIKKAKVHEGLLNKSSSIEKLNKDIDEMNGKIQNLKTEIEVFKNNIDEYYKKIEKNKLNIESIEKEREMSNKKIEELNLNEIKIKEDIKVSDSESQSLELEINKKEEEFHNLELNLTKLITESENIHSRLETDMKIKYEDALEYKTKIDDMESFRNKIESLKKKISDIGVVNLGAIEEYEGLKKKVVFMNSQREDLIKAEDELKSLITQMTKKIKVVFNENFNILRKNFNETFKELFKGGSADLILTGGDELTGSIDINVQPPGKKLQNINLMSGGEKGLSAIALLFAILKMKPTPFCILDEIEAALDDANVARYAEFLKKFSKNTQFIVITHRKGTMEASDVLYGVTMEEKGISKIVSVDLNEQVS